jgi:hypothetical protein
MQSLRRMMYHNVLFISLDTLLSHKNKLELTNEVPLDYPEDQSAAAGAFFTQVHPDNAAAS